MKSKDEKVRADKTGIPGKRFERMLQNSPIARFLLFLGSLEERVAENAVSRRFRHVGDRNGKGLSRWRKVKKTVAKEIEQSLFLSWINRFFALLLRLPVRAYGTLLLTASLMTAVVSAVKNYIAGQGLLSVKSMVVFACVAAASLILIAVSKKKSLGEAVIGSRLISFILFEIIGVRKRSFETADTAEVSYLSILIISAICAALSIFISPSVILRVVFWALFVRLAFYSPESGFVTVLLFLPFFSDIAAAAAVILVIASYIVKIFRSQRAFRMSFYGICMILFAVLALFSTLMTPASGDGMPFLSCFTAVAPFFLARLLLGRREWIRRASSAVVFSGIAAGIWVSVLFAMWYLPAQYQSIFPFISDHKFPFGFSGLESAGVYIAAATALLVTRYRKTKGVGWALLAVAGGLILCAGAILSQRPAAWLCLAAALLIVLILNKNFTIIPVAIGAAALVVVYRFVLPTGITSYVAQYSNGFSTQTGVVLSQLSASASRIFFGAGEAAVMRGENFFSHILTSSGFAGIIFLLFSVIGIVGRFYSSSRKNENVSRQIKQIMNGSAAAAVALLITGICFDLWTDVKLPFLLFAMLGMTLSGAQVLNEEGAMRFMTTDLDRDIVFIPVIRKEKPVKEKPVKEKSVKEKPVKEETPPAGSPVPELPAAERTDAVPGETTEGVTPGAREELSGAGGEPPAELQNTGAQGEAQAANGAEQAKEETV